MDAPSTPVRVLVVDDHAVVRHGVAALLDRAPGVEVCAEAGSREEAVLAARAHDPDVVVMDVRLGDGDGVTAMREVLAERPGTRVLMLSAYADDETVIEAMTQGAVGYVLKQVSGTELVDAVRSAAEGRSTLDSRVADVVTRTLRHRTDGGDDPLARLSAHEERLVALVAQGRSNRQIAEALHLAEKTVKNQLGRVFATLGVSGRREAAAYYAARSARQPDRSPRSSTE